jgi:hypothetical protein
MGENDRKTPEELLTIVERGSANLLEIVVCSGDPQLINSAIDIGIKAGKTAEELIEEQEGQA